MNIIFVGGANVKHVDGVLNKRFSSSSISLTYIKYVTDIENLIKTGKAIDRLVILDKGYLVDTDSLEDTKVRELTLDLANYIRILNETRKVEVVFMIEDKDLAFPIEEEMFEFFGSFKVVERIDTKAQTFVNAISDDLVDLKNVIDTSKSASKTDGEHEDLWGDDGDSDFELGGEFERTIDSTDDLLGDFTWDDNSFDFEEEGTEVEEEFGEFTGDEFGWDSADNDNFLTSQESIIEEPIEEELTEEVCCDNFEEDNELGEDTGFGETAGFGDLGDFLGDGFGTDFEEENEQDIDTTEYEQYSEVEEISLPSEEIGSIEEEPVQQVEKVDIPEPVERVPNKKEKKKFGIGSLFSKGKRVDVKTSNIKEVKADENVSSDAFNSDMYSSSKDINTDTNISNDDYELIRNYLNKMSIKKASYIFSGTSCSGTSTTAYHISTLIARMGFNVLLVGMDVKNNTYSYLSRDLYEIVHAGTDTSCSLTLAINDCLNIPNYTSIIEQGLHVLTMGLDVEPRPLNVMISKEKLARFVGFARQTYDFVIYDIPTEYLQSVGEEIVFSCDELIYTVESSTDGLMRLLLNFGNIENEELRAIMFSKSHILLTKYLDQIMYFGKKVKKEGELLGRLDEIAEEITGSMSEYRFCDIKVLGVIPFNFNMVNSVFSKENPMDSKDNQKVMLKVIHGLLNY